MKDLQATTKTLCDIRDELKSATAEEGYSDIRKSCFRLAAKHIQHAIANIRPFYNCEDSNGKLIKKEEGL